MKNNSDGRSPAAIWGQEKGTWVLSVRVQEHGDICHCELCCENVPAIFIVLGSRFLLNGRLEKLR